MTDHQQKPGKIQDWNPSPEYVSENLPVERKIIYKDLNQNVRKRSARGDAARESVSEFVSKPWENYFDDVETLPLPTALMNPQKMSSIPNRTKSLDDGRRKSLPKSRIQSAQNTIGPYLQTTTRRLTPKTPADVDVYAKGTNFGSSRVLFPFKARSSRELSVEKGDQVTILSIIDDKWVECHAKSQTGLVPRSYIEESTSTPRVVEYGSAIAKFDFVGSASNQLSFNKGDNLVLIRKIDQNWFEGRINNSQKGYIPVTFIEVQREPTITGNKTEINQSINMPANQINESKDNEQSVDLMMINSQLRARCLSDQEDDVFITVPTRDSGSDIDRELDEAVNELSTLALRVSAEFDDTIRENTMV